MKLQSDGLKSLLACALMVASAGFSAASHAQVVDATPCEVAAHPDRFDGKIVRIKGLVQVGFDTFIIRGNSCSSSVWLSYPAGTKAKSGPSEIVTLQLAANGTGTPGTVRPAITLDRNKDFETFDTLLSARVKTPGMCLGCFKNDVMATLTGRIDGTVNAGVDRGADGKTKGVDGFGNLNAYGARMVLQSVSEVSAQEIDYSKAPKVKDDNPGGGGKDYMALTKKAEDAFGKTNDASAQIQRAVDAFGAPGVDNGVIVSFGATAEVPAGEGTKNAKASPDGLLLTLAIDPALKGDALSRAIAFAGEEIADVREGKISGYENLEQKAWNSALLVTIGSRQKTLTLDGGIVVWTEEWAPADRNGNAGVALTKYLEDRSQAPR